MWAGERLFISSSMSNDFFVSCPGFDSYNEKIKVHVSTLIFFCSYAVLRESDGEKSMDFTARAWINGILSLFSFCIVPVVLIVDPFVAWTR